VPGSGPSWPFVIARGITLLRSGGSGGYIGDGWGGPHPFNGAPAINPANWGGPYWPGWDIARGIAL
jgi:hypothetical protein